jgi:membrane associated rhomboid family serine protease
MVAERVLLGGAAAAGDSMSEAGPELSVVCKSCGSEVSPYVTECPYCGTRLRKRAPKLERVGDEVRVREGRRERRRRRAAERRARAEARRERLALASEYPLVTIAAILGPATLLVVERATGLTVFDLGAIGGAVGAEWWRYLTASFVFDDVGFIFAYGVAVAIFLTGVERRLGIVPAALLVIATGGLGMLGADLLESAVRDQTLVTWGGNGIAFGALCAWTVLREAELRADPEEGYERFAVAVAAVVILLLPLFDDVASVWAGLVGGLVGAAFGLAVVLGRRGG